MKTLWKQRLFTNISIDAEKIVGDQIFLVIKVEERPRIGGKAFSGLKNSEKEELLSLDLRTGQVYTENFDAAWLLTPPRLITLIKAF